MLNNFQFSRFKYILYFSHFKKESIIFSGINGLKYEAKINICIKHYR